MSVSNLFKLLTNRFFALSKSGDKRLRKGKHIPVIHGVDLESGASQKKTQTKATAPIHPSFLTVRKINCQAR